MDVYQSIWDQLGSFFTSGAMRIVDSETGRVVQEKREADFAGCFPDLTPAQVLEHLNCCLSMGKPLLNLIHSGNRLLLLIESPFPMQGRTALLEILVDGTDNIFFNMSEWDTERKLICELKHLHEQNITDSLTGLYNRRYIDDGLPVAIRNCITQEQPLSILFADVDFYKNVNDRYGHAAGDFVLSELAGIFAQSTRKKEDWVARYGGEEFLIFLNDCENKTAKDVAERMRIAIMDHVFLYNGQSIRITCSFGVITIDDFSVSLSTDKILDTVDKRLFQAKRLGRNVVV